MQQNDVKSNTKDRHGAELVWGPDPSQGKEGSGTTGIRALFLWNAVLYHVIDRSQPKYRAGANFRNDYYQYM